MIMTKVSLYLILLFCYVQAYSYDEDLLRRGTEQRILDSINVSFNNFEGSDRFINKFSLSKDELDIIGIWGFDGIFCKTPPDRQYGPGLTITFYPNRYFCIYREDKSIGKIKEIFGEWRVIDKNLQIKFRAKLIIAENLYDIEYFNNNLYYTIFSVPNYEIAYVNKTPFDWSGVSSDVLSFFEFGSKDSPRSRLLLDPLGDPPGDLKEGAQLGDTLFYPSMSKDYLIKLMNIW
jgi:hypothetical protein